MKLSRNVVMAFKNMGDAAHDPEIFHGTLAGSIEWMITKVAEKTIAKRFVFNIARNESEALSGLEGRALSKTDASSLRLANLLASVVGEDDEDDDSQDQQTAERSNSDRLPANGDDYIPRSQRR